MLLAAFDIALILIPKSKDHKWSQQALMVLLFFMGLSNMIGFIAGYTLFCECAPERRQPLLGSLWNMSEGAIIIWITLYYVHVSRSWEHLIWVVIGAHFVFAIVMTFALVESPKWLYKNQRYVECYKALTYMGKCNGVESQPLAEKLLNIN